ncbi:hypothetical protein ABHV46_10820 [Asaia sp. BMEF1]|uniref:hypothetical protein n=1 Tax=Asaia sp. BMEF1 TaxID=3155932 RepID=UPI003F664D54
MIDVFSLASGALGIVNPATTVTVKCSDGYEIQPDGSPKLKTFTLTAQADIQAVSAGDLEHVASINQQADMRAVYIRGGLKGLSRPLHVGGDLLNFYGSDWLVTQPVEEWGYGEWSKVIVTRQTAAPSPM